MTDIEEKALALVNEISREEGWEETKEISAGGYTCAETLCRAIEQHEAFRQEVSDAVEAFFEHEGYDRTGRLRHFIIAKPDPLADALESVLLGFEDRKHAESYANQIRAALEVHGLEIRSKNDDR